MQKTGIEWTDYSTNPLRAIDLTTGKRGWVCTAVSAGCDHCYSEVLNRRWGTRLPYDKAAEDAVRWELNEVELRAIVASKATGARVFVADMTDLFHIQVRREWLDRIFAVFAARPDLTFQCLTKRPQIARNYLNDRETRNRVRDQLYGWAESDSPKRIAWPFPGMMPWPLPNVWLGTSVEDARVLHRLKPLGECPAAVRFLSCEPLIGSLGPTFRGDLADSNIGWVIAGGESGPEHRPVAAEWVIAIRDACQDAGVPFFFKQWGGKTPKSGGRLLEGREWSEFPTVGERVGV